MRYKIIDSLCYIPTEEVFVDLLISLPPQMSRYLKDIFGPRVSFHLIPIKFKKKF